MTYQCHVCKETFEEDWTEEEAEKELQENFPGFKKEECEVVCDDCYERFMKYHKGE